jgi:hypothetical protein
MSVMRIRRMRRALWKSKAADTQGAEFAQRGGWQRESWRRR